MEESIVDMAAVQWERRYGGREDVSLQELVDFHPRYLKRFARI